MAVLSNDGVRAGAVALAAASSDDDAYQIENCLRIDSDDDARLKRKQVEGNNRVYTVSTWLKKTVLPGAYQSIFFAGKGSTSEGFGFKEDGTLYSYIGGQGGNTYPIFLNDYTGWYHIVMSVDLTHPEDMERVRMWVNGAELFHQDNYPNQHVESYINHEGYHVAWGARDIGASWAGNCYLADSYMIDGLALSGAAFGSFDSTGTWNPKAFSIPAPNDGTTWSGKISGSFDGSNNATKVFDGSISTYGYPDAGQTVTFTPDSPMTCQNLRVYARNDANGGGVKVNGEYQGDITTTPKWYDYTPKSHSITNISWHRASSGSIGCQVYAVEIDGVILKDGVRDSAERNNPNTGTVWSKNGTISGNSTANTKTFDRLFDGRLDQYAEQSGDNVTLSWTPSPAITVKKRMRIYFAVGGDPDDTVINGDATAINVDPANGWVDVAVPEAGMNFSKLEMKRGGSGVYARASAIEIDGHLLLDNTFDNSHHLKYNDTTGTSAVVKNTLTDASILSGSIKEGLDYYDDPDKANIKFAMTGEDLNDHSATIKGSGSNLTVSASGAATATDYSALYGTSLYFDGSNDEITCSNSSAFDYGTGAFTIECWFMMKTFSGNMRLMSSGTGTANQKSHYQLCVKSDGAVRFDYDTTVGHTITSTSGIIASTYQWYHIAVVRDTTPKATLYLNGKVVASSTNANTGYNANNAEGITLGRESSGSEWFNGWMNDFRMYNKAKYTAEFTPPQCSSFTPSNVSVGGTQVFSSGITYGGQSFKGGHEAVKGFDGKLGTRIRTNASSNNGLITFTPGTAIAYTSKIRAYNGTGDSTMYSATWSLNGGSATAISSTGWIDIATGSGTLTSLSATRSGDGEYFSAIEVDGQILTDPIEGDIFVDSPTNYGTDTGVGGEVRGNYATCNPRDKNSNITLTNGNLSFTHAGSNGYWYIVRGTMSMPAGKWYFEITAGDQDTILGIATEQHSIADDDWVGESSYGYGYSGQSGNKRTNGSNDSYGNTFTADDVIGVAFDADNGKLWFSKGGTWQNSGNPATAANPAFTGISQDNWMPAISVRDNSTGHVNFGQRAFKYTAPSGFKAVCSANLPDLFSGDAKNNPSKYFDARTYVGTGSAITLPADFATDFSILKRRNQASNPQTFDRVNGFSNTLATSSNGALAAVAMISATTDSSYTLGTDGSVNEDDDTYVHWMWDAGDSVASTSNGGSATNYTRWTNATAGFTVMKATCGTGSGYHQKTLDHGLGATPDVIWSKATGGSENWHVFHSTVGTGSVGYLNNSDAFNSSDSHKVSAVSNTQITYDNYGQADVVFYCWTDIAGYSASGTYTGSSGEPFVNTGFRPAYVCIKRTDSAASWYVFDNGRSPTNEAAVALRLNSNVVDQSYYLSLCATGFLVESSSDGDINGAGATYMWHAIAEYPFKTARAK